MDNTQDPTDDTISQEGFATLDDASVQDAEIVSPSSSDDQSQVLTSLDAMIKAHVQSIDRLKDDVRKHKEMIEDGLSNDPVYREHDEAVKAATKIRQATKSQIMKQPAVAQLNAKLKSLSSELKEKNTSLSDYLLEYQKVSGANQIEMDDGEILEIVNSAKILRKSSK